MVDGLWGIKFKMSSTKTVSGRNPATGKGLLVVVEGDHITDIKSTSYTGSHWISAGLIDLQVNGFAGIDLNDGAVNPDRVLALAHKLSSLGITTFLPTVITASFEQVHDTLDVIHRARLAHPLLARMIPCIHLEGPCISPEDGPRGAHPAEHVRPPNLQEFNTWQQVCDRLIGLVTLSPHWSNTAEFIQALVQQGVYVSIGHTHADHLQINAAVDAGARLSTHLGNGASAMMPRHPNAIWSQLADDNLSATFIADGHHLPAETFKSMLRAKGLSKSILVSDVAAPGGLAPGTYQQYIGGNVVLNEDGRLGIEGTPYLAGAARPLSDCVATAITMAEITLADALTMATTNPGQFIGRSGQLALGEPADIISFDWEPGQRTLDIQQVFIGGSHRI